MTLQAIITYAEFSVYETLCSQYRLITNYTDTLEIFRQSIFHCFSAKKLPAEPVCCRTASALSL